LQGGGNVNNTTLVWAGNVTLNSTASIGSNSVVGNPLTIIGTISGSGDLIKVGSGFVTLQAANAYTGNTIVDAGTLTLNSTGSIATSPNLTVNIGGALTLDNTVGGTAAG